MQQALATRDRLLNALPAYSHWLAARPLPDLDAVHLWQELHQLILALAMHEPPERISAHARAAGTLFDQLEQEFDHCLQALAAAATPTAVEMRTAWLDTEVVLALPHRDVARRLWLIARQQELERRLLLCEEAEPGPSAGDMALSQACREGDMALALLGQLWFDQMAGPRGETYRQTQHRLEVLASGNLEPSVTEWESLARVGCEIGRRFQQVPDEIQHLTTASRHLDLKQKQRLLGQAADLSQLMEAPCSLPAVEPGAACRHLRLAEFLLGQARRTLQDHWFGEAGDDEPYYRAAGRLFLADARSLLGGADDAVAELERRFQAPGELVVVDATNTETDRPAPGCPVLTCEQALQRQYRLAPAPGGWLPAGNAVLWLQPAPGLVASFAGDAGPANGTPQPQRHMWPVCADARVKGQSELLRCNVAVAAPLPAPATDLPNLVIQGRFRGQMIRVETPLDVHPLPEITLRRYSLGGGTGVAVRIAKDVMPGLTLSVDGKPPASLTAAVGEGIYRWYGTPLPPGAHKIGIRQPVGGNSVLPSLDREIFLSQGDMLLLDLVRSPSGSQLERYRFSEEFSRKPAVETARKDWKLTVLQNQRVGRSALQMLVTLEKSVVGREGPVSQIKPRDVWLEVQPAGVTAKPAMRWAYLGGYPAPAFVIEADAWPADADGTPAQPIVRLWWNSDADAPPAANLPLAPLLAPGDHAIALRDGTGVVVESLRTEQHHVEVRPGVVETRACLVARLRHGREQALAVSLQGLPMAGNEHRLYTSAGRYTGLFWFAPDADVTRQASQVASAHLCVISLDAFKKEARGRGYYLEISDLPAPDAADVRPRPPLEWK